MQYKFSINGKTVQSQNSSHILMDSATLTLMNGISAAWKETEMRKNKILESTPPWTDREVTGV